MDDHDTKNGLSESLCDEQYSHIKKKNEEAREKLFECIAEEQEKRKKIKRSKKTIYTSISHAFLGLLKKHERNDLERFSSDELFETAQKTEQTNIPAEADRDTVPVQSDDKGHGKEQCPANENAQLVQALAACSDDYAIFVYGITPPDISKELQMKCLQAGIDVLGASIYPVGNGMYAGILNDCWSNRNAMERMKQELFLELKRMTGLEFSVVTLGVVKKRELSPAMCLQRSLARLQPKAEPAHETDTDNLQGLITHLRKEIESNAIEQARRQFEQQMEENGELIPEEPVVIREAVNMSPAEYDSYLSEDEQKMKREAKARYIDDDVSIAQVLHNIEKHRTLDDPLYLIAIASVDMNTLIILEDTEDFETLCNEADVSMIQCSYIYAISRSGGHWYGNNHATKEIENIFNGLSEIIVQNGGRFRKEYLYSVPNISIFKDIFLQ